MTIHELTTIFAIQAKFISERYVEEFALNHTLHGMDAKKLSAYMHSISHKLSKEMASTSMELISRAIANDLDPTPLYEAYISHVRNCGLEIMRGIDFRLNE